MRRPALHHTTGTALRVTGGWSHPYAPSPFIFYADGGNADPAAPAPAPAGGTPADPPKPGPPPGTITLTEDELQKRMSDLAAREKAQGKRSAAREFAEKHGFNSVEDAEAFIAEARQAREAQLSEQEKEARRIAEEKTKLDQERAAVASERRTLARERALGRLGAIDTEEQPNLQDALAMLERDLRDQPDADETAVAEAATKLKARRPELFGAARPADDTTPPAPITPPAPGGAPAGGPPPRQPATKTDTKARAHALAVKMGYAKPDTAA